MRANVKHKATENSIASSTLPRSRTTRLFTASFACFSPDPIERAIKTALSFSQHRPTREPLNAGGARVFPAGASDKPLEYVDLQIKKFTSVSHERASSHPFQSSESVLKFQTYFTVTRRGGGGTRAKICDYL